MPRLTIIIPAAGDDRQLEETLGSILRHRPANCEVVVAHDGAYSDPYDLGDEVRFVRVRPGAGATELLNIGLGAARSSWLHFLWPGCEVAENWTDAAVGRFRESQAAAIAPWVGRQDCGAVGCEYRGGGSLATIDDRATIRRGAVLATLARASYFRVESLKAIGGLDEWLGPDWAMIDAALALRARGETVVGEPKSRVFGETSPVEESKGAYRWARDAERVFWRHRASFTQMAAHAVHVFAEGLRGITKLNAGAVVTGRAIGALDAARGKRRSGVIRSAESEEPTSGDNEKADAQTDAQSDIAKWRPDRAHPSRDPRMARSVGVR